MDRVEDDRHAGKEALRELREARKDVIERAARRMKEHRKAVDALKGQLTAGGLTIPELAEATGISTSRVMWYVATLKKYGEVAEGEKEGGYFRYGLAGAAADSTPQGVDKG